MSEFKPNKLWLKEKLDAENYRQKIREKLLKFIDANPEVDQYLEHERRNAIVYGIIIGALVSAILGEILFCGYMLGSGWFL
jgi:hypothetical protein